MQHNKDFTTDSGSASAVAQSQLDLSSMVHQLLEIAPLPVYQQDKFGHFVACNKAFEELVGLNHDQVIGSRLFDWADQEDAERQLAKDQELLENGGTQEYRWSDFQWGHADANVMIRKCLVSDDAGNPEGILAMISVEKKTTDTEPAAVEPQPAPEPAPAATPAPVAANDDSSELEKVKAEFKEFSYIISHDLRAPLRGIRSLADWIYSDYADKMDDDGREQMDMLITRVSRLTGLIEGVLQFSRIGRIVEPYCDIDLNDALPSIIEKQQPPNNVHFDIQKDLPTVRWETNRIEQLFGGIIHNAFFFNDKEEPHVEIGCEDDGDFWKFHITDNGPGIDEKHYDRVYRLFQTLTPKDELETTGVGLTLCKKIVEVYGGRIWLESTKGEKTTFFFTLPKVSQEMDVSQEGPSEK